MQGRYTVVPNLLLKLLGELDITPNELVFTLEVWVYWHEQQRDVFPALNTIAERMNIKVMCATTWLDTVEPGHFPRGLFLQNAYELSSTYERVLGGPPRGERQEELGRELARNLREQTKTQMLTAGWQVVAYTKEGQKIWQYQPERVALAQSVTTRHVTVTRKARPISFICEVCNTHTTQVRFPGPKPRYCSDHCKQISEQEKARKRVARLRARRKKEREAHG
jgi:predicted nucleic acid-binding Zn ribbon protein